MFIARQEPFTCENCNHAVQPLDKGTYRDHCPECLWSKHVDLEGPGDRKNPCKGMLKPKEIDQNSKKGFVIVYECMKCGEIQNNKSAPDDELSGFMQRRSNDS